MTVDKQTINLRVGESTNVTVSGYDETFTCAVTSGATKVIVSSSVQTGLIVVTGALAGSFTLVVTSGSESVTITGTVSAAEQFITLSDDFTEPLSDYDRSIFNRQTAINKNIEIVLNRANSVIETLRTVQNHLIAVEVITGTTLASSIANIGLAIADLRSGIKVTGKESIEAPNKR